MARDFARALYKSKAWKSLREAYMQKPVACLDGRVCPPGMCERCFERGKLVPAEICHHIIHLNRDNVGDPNISLNPDNLMRVCRDCHAEIHYPDDYRPRMAFGPDGRALPLGDEED